MSYTVKQPSLAGRIGKGIGQGLSEQVPKEIERHRLSSGLKKLGEKDFSNQNIFQSLGDLYGVAGMTPELANVGLQQIQNQNFLKRTPGQVGEEAPTSSQAAKTSVPSAPQVNEGGFVSPQDIESYKASIVQEPSALEINNLAKEILQSGQTQDPNEATRLANAEIAQNRSAQQTKNATLRKTLDDQISSQLHNSGLKDFGEVTGNIIKSLVDQGEYMANKGGLTPELAADKISNITLDLAKARNDVREAGSLVNSLKPSATKIETVKNSKKQYEKYGFGEDFDNMAIADLNITPLQYSHEMNPLQNKEVKADIKKYGTKIGMTNLNDQKWNSIIKNIKPNDDIYSVEYELRDHGIDITKFREKLREYNDKNHILSSRQERQLGKPLTNSIFGDILFKLRK